MVLTAVLASGVNDLGAAIAMVFVFVARSSGSVRFPRRVCSPQRLPFVESILQPRRGVGAWNLLDESDVPGLALVMLITRRGASFCPASSRGARARSFRCCLWQLSPASSTTCRCTFSATGTRAARKGHRVLYVVLDAGRQRDRPAVCSGVVLGAGVIALQFGFSSTLRARQLFAAIGIEPGESRAGLPSVKGLFVDPFVFAAGSRRSPPSSCSPSTRCSGDGGSCCWGRRSSWQMILAARRRAMLVLGAGPRRRHRLRACLFIAAAGRGFGGGAGWSRPWSCSSSSSCRVCPALDAMTLGALRRDTEVTWMGTSGRKARSCDSPPGRVPRSDLGSIEITKDDFPFGAGLGRIPQLDQPCRIQPGVRGVRPRSYFVASTVDKAKFATDMFWPQGALARWECWGWPRTSSSWRRSPSRSGRSAAPPGVTMAAGCFCLGAGMVRAEDPRRVARVLHVQSWPPRALPGHGHVRRRPGPRRHAYRARDRGRAWAPDQPRTRALVFMMRPILAAREDRGNR